MSSKRIFKNSIILYLRMFFVMGATLFIVRLLLEKMGILDYGIYNVVAGVVYTFNFLTAIMTSSTQRFMSYYIGKKDNESLLSVFNVSMATYFGIVIIVLLLGETIGLWFLNNKLIIPIERIYAANYIYQLALLTFIFSMISVPYRSFVIAQEKMNIFALISILEVSLKLLFILFMNYITFDKLIYYGIILLLIQIILLVIYVFVCRKYKECSFKICRDKDMYKSIISFSGWIMYGTLAGVGITQGNTILTNLFFGAIVNASRAVSMQIGTALSTFAQSFIMAIRPPIIKAYAENNYGYLEKLYYFSNKFIYYLLLIIFIPLIIKTEYILILWLGEVAVDNNMIVFSKLILIQTFILSLHSPITILIQATGKVRKYFTIVETFTLLSMPLTYIVFKLGFSAESTYIVNIVIFIIAHIYRLIILQQSLSIFKIKDYFKRFLIKALFISFVTLIGALYVEKISENELISLFIIVCYVIIVIAVLVYLFVLSSEEKLYIKKLLKLT